MQNRQTNQVFNFDKFPNFEKDIDLKQRAWIEVKGEAIETNVRQLRSQLSKNCHFMAVVKADGYGHDAKLVSEYAIKGGASQLGVATLNEGIKLRSSGVKKPILILGNLYTKMDLIISYKNDLMPTISSIRECLVCYNIGKHFGLKFSLHLKVDTGMSRLGFESNKFVQQFEKIKSFENILIEGIYSHLSSADEAKALDSKSTTQLQRLNFNELFFAKLIKILLASILMGIFFNYLILFFENKLIYQYNLKSIYLILSSFLSLVFYLSFSLFIKAFKYGDIKLKY